MPHRFILFAIILALASKEFQTAGTHKKKQLVSVQHFAKGSSGPRDHVCGGVLLTRRFLLTACSCVTKVRVDPTTRKKTAVMMDTERILVYVGTVMDTSSMKKTKDSEVQRVGAMFTHPMCDTEFSYDFALVVARGFFSIKGLLLVKTLHRALAIKEFVIGRLDLPRACSTLSWMSDNRTAPCVTSEFNRKYEFSIDDMSDDILRRKKMRESSGKRNSRSPVDGGYEVVLKALSSNYFAKSRIDVDFVEKKYCTSLVSVCALNPHGCIKGIHGLRCGEWCMRSLDCTERLCQIDTGSPVFCNKVLVGIVSGTRVISCEGSNQILAIVSGFDSALQFVRNSLSSYKDLAHQVRSFKSPKASGVLPMILILITMLVYLI